ncbi:MAG: hypothetical protein KDK62_06720, partial [Chlamydiia bacterium]|nr:hypothetical protein [Chlamydiia bacterium]
MSEDMNVNQGGAGFIPDYNPETQGTGQTQGGVQTTQQPITDTPVDTIETSQTANTQATTQTAIPSDNTIPRLNAPNAALIAGAPQGPITQAPQAGEQGYTNALMAFTTPGQPPDAAAQAYSAFIAEFPPGSPEYEAMLDVLNFNMTNPNLPDSMELFAAAREQIIESGALEENVTGTTGPNSRNALRENRIPVQDLTQSDLESMSPEQLSAYSEAEIQEIIQKFPDYATHVAGLAAEEIMMPKVDADQIDYEKAFNLSGTIEEWIQNAENLIKGLPDSAEKDTMLGFLSKISAALQEFTELLYALQATDSEKTREFTAAKLDESLSKIEKQRKAMRKQIRAARKGKEKKKMGVMG